MYLNITQLLEVYKLEHILQYILELLNLLYTCINVFPYNEKD